MKPFIQSAAFILLASLLAVLLAGCDKDDKFSLAFSHQLHVTENEMACKDCHGKMTDGHFSAAGHKACKECHGDWMDTQEINAKTCGMCHKVKDIGKISQAEPTNAVAKVSGVFLHTAALTNRCADCHGALFDKKQKLVLKLTPKEKIRIREKAHRWGMSCAACHEDMDPKTPPPSHQKNWTRRHGAMGTLPDSTCGMCHSKESCRECHQVTQPASHNDLWRLRTHGIQAAWDRERCLVCHQQDFCTACHLDTRPKSHNAGWGKSHCMNCHPSKSTGTGCTLCHETDLGSHPNPHTAGWRKRHCFACHEGSARNQCAVCHGSQSVIDIHDNFWTAVHNRLPAGVDCYFCHGK
ncbi:MAG: cytochrome c3 family protein [bacterium]